MINKIEIDWRNGNFRGYNYTGNGDNMLDIRIDIISKDTITFRHYPAGSGSLYQDIRNVNKYIKMWDLYGVADTIDRYPYSKGLMSSDSLYNECPINGEIYYNNGNIFNPSIHEDPGDIGMNVVINNNVTTRDTLIESPTSILIPSNGFLKINNGKKFEITSAVNGYNVLVVQDSSTLILEQNSKLIVDATNRLLLKKTGTISLGYNSEIWFKDGSSFCNQGGIITSPQGGGTGSQVPGKIRVDSGYHPQNWCTEISDFLFNGNVKLELEYGATLEIPDSITLHFTGTESGLIMNPLSKLKMGAGSKILFDNSAKLIADSAEFCSINSANTWEGIVLENSSFDTIKNCTLISKTLIRA